jgi:hypothetical protein
MKRLVVTLLIVLALIGAWVIYRSATAPTYAHTGRAEMIPSDDPEQTDPEGAPPVTLAFPDGQLTLSPQAAYRVTAKVASRQRYPTPWAGTVAPYDLVLLWGPLATADLRWLHIEQDMRWYHFSFRSGAPFDVGFVASHSANTHVIPATPNLRRAVARLDEGGLAEFTGYLVFAQGTVRGGPIEWNSSLTRADTGAGSCELFYVTSIRVGDRLYR